MYEKSMCPEILRDEKKYKPFMLCSRNPGIGFGFMKADIIEFYRRHPRDYVRAWAGHKMAMPRYYADKLYDDDMKAFLKEMREEFFRHKCSMSGLIIVLVKILFLPISCSSNNAKSMKKE